MTPAPNYALGRAQKPQDCFARLRRTRARFSSTARFSSITASLTRCASTSKMHPRNIFPDTPDSEGEGE